MVVETKMNKKSASLKQMLDRVLADFPPSERISADPIQFPRALFDQGRADVEIEAVALFSAMLAYGSAKQFTKKIRLVMEACNWNFLELITKNHAEMPNWPGYRLSTADEIKSFAKALGMVIEKHKSLKNVFLKGYSPDKSIKAGEKAIQTAMIQSLETFMPEVPRGIKHLLPDPTSGGCAKRWQMFLRWMVRGDDGVDMGLWKEIPSSELIIPLDRHISKISRNLGLTSRNADDWKTAEEISAKLAEMEPADPIKYDFSLCHLGISGECTHGKNQDLCGKCLLKNACQFGKNLNKKRKESPYERQ